MIQVAQACSRNWLDRLPDSVLGASRSPARAARPAILTTWIILLACGVIAGTIGGVVGFGASVVLLPALVLAFGAKAAVPIMMVAGMMGNATRVAVWWREVDWRVNAYYCLTAIPAAALGARTLLMLDPRLLEGAIGVFLILFVPVRRWLLDLGWKMQLPYFLVIGACIGFLTGLVAATGPINTPFFLAYGLSRGGYIGTEALGSTVIGLTKGVVFQTFGALDVDVLLNGVIVGSAMVSGSYFAKFVVERMSPDQYRWVMDVLMLGSGAAMLWGALGALA